MPAEQYHDFPLAPRDRTWDKTAAVNRCRQWASSDGSGDKDKMDWQKYRKVFFWHEAGTLSDFGQFKFPYCDIINGGPHVVHNAVQNALARIDGSDIPADDKPAVRSVAERQMARFQNQNQSMDSSEIETFARRFGEPTQSQLDKINALAKRPLSKDEVFTFEAKLAGDMIIPNRYIKLSRQLLEVFKKDAQNGIALMIGHPWAEIAPPKAVIPYGRTFDASIRKSNVAGEEWALYADHYMVLGQEMDGISTDAIAASIETGVMFDTSIGWCASVYECSICGKDYRRCEHWAGRTYDVEGKGQQLCYAIAKPPGFLMENSLVFDGAYPTAGVLSATGEAEDKNYLSITDLKSLSADVPAFNIFSVNKGRMVTLVKKADMPKKIFAMSEPKGGENEMTNTTISFIADDGKVLKTYTVGEDGKIKWDSPAELVPAQEPKEAFMAKEQATEKLGKEYTADEVLRFAKEGIDYHKQTVDEAIAMGVRAMGNDFPAETWRNTFANMSTKAIKDIAKTWEAQAKAAIPAGRQTDPAAGLGQQKATSAIPDDAFKVK